MGMDSYLIKVKKADFDAYADAYRKSCELQDKNEKQIGETYKKLRSYVYELEDKYRPVIEGNIDQKALRKHATKDEICKMDDLFDTYDKLCGNNLFNGINCEPGDTLMYWRKAFGLHGYVIDNYCKDRNNDNCQRIPIPKKGLEHMLHFMKECLNNGFEPIRADNPFGSDNWWRRDTLEASIRALEKIIPEYKDDEQVYYYAWY